MNEPTFSMFKAFFAESPFIVQILMLGGLGFLLASLAAMIFCFFEKEVGEDAARHLGAMSFIFFYTGVFLIIAGGFVIWIPAMYNI